MKKIVTVFVLFVALFQSSTLMAQDILKSTDLSTVKVDYMTDGDIAKIQAQLLSKNLTIEQVEPMALEKGMSATEFAKLKKRISTTQNTGRKDDISKKTDKDKEGKDINKEDADKEDKAKFEKYKKSNEGRKQQKIENNKIKDSINAKIFGSELFDNPTLNFEPDLKLATPVNYILGPGDELQVSVYGVQEYSSSLPVSPEGKIDIQYVGQIAVSGMTIEGATQKIKAAIAKVYSTVKSGQSQVTVNLGGIRTIKVTVIGSKQPGNYSVSSLATVFNALYLAGGPGANGSYRNIELIRNNKVYKNIDIYRFLVSGSQSDNVGLKENDVIRIPAYSQRVVVEGEVKRPGIF